ncbi:MAG: YceI family protein [Streptosporangiaceae bacterium]
MPQTLAMPGYRAGTWDIDPIHSHVGFVARHLMVGRVRGSFADVTGEITTAADPLRSSATAVIQVASLTTGSTTRDGDVLSEHFLGAADHPTITYRCSGLRQSGERITADGELTVRGVTRPVTLTVEMNGFGPDPYGCTRTGLCARGEISRGDFGVTTNAVLPGGGVVVSDSIELVIDVEAVLRIT